METPRVLRTNCAVSETLAQLLVDPDDLTRELFTESFGAKSLETAPERSSTRIREGFFTEFAEKVQALNSPIPVQLSGGAFSHAPTTMSHPLTTVIRFSFPYWHG